MTLLDTIRLIESVAAAQPSVNMIVRNDIFRLNTYADARYGVFAWVQQQHQADTSSGFITFAFSFIYADRVTADRSNETEVQSVGIQTLNNIIRRLDETGIDAGSYTFTTFNQRFLDDCAGVFCNVSFTVPADSLCAEDYADFNDDFNEDFLII